ncbi:MAG: diaminopimelate decarboxylase [Planctomycetes bacterium SM23_32]|nr:MAG: diaminopimelate decarboxylase [Planctomycetes bacterium SM23_32]
MAVQNRFTYRAGELYCEDVPAERIAAEHGTPCYVYSRASLLERYADIRDAFGQWGALVCFSVKCCGNLSVLKLLAEAGSGFDVVSGGEICRALRAGADPQKIVFAGVGKTGEEIEYALREGILMLNVESRPELEAINVVATRLGARAAVAIRLNPDVDARTHAKTTTGKGGTKFGIGIRTAERLALDARSWDGVEVRGIHLHLGSPIYSAEPYESALTKALELVERLREAGCPVDTLNLGGGYCISYTGEEVTTPQQYAAALRTSLEKSACPVIIIEPGRYIAGNGAVLLTRMIYRKESEFGKRFLICDAAMNDLIRPTLYEAFHRVWPVRSAEGMPQVVRPDQSSFEGLVTERVDVVGPVCETGDYLARNRPLPRVEAGELLAVFDVGAYGFAMGSNYNARPRAAEVLVDGAECRLIRRRETCGDMIGPEEEWLI